MMCIEPTKCPFFSELLKYTPIPRPKFVINLIKEKECGFDGKTPYVCCHLSSRETSTEQPTTVSSIAKEEDSVSSETYTSTENTSIDNLESAINSHPNYRLLSNDICGPSATDSRITSGTKATLNEYPWMALLAYKIGESFNK